MREWWNTVGRPTIGSRPMTPAERQRRSRALRRLQELKEAAITDTGADEPAGKPQASRPESASLTRSTPVTAPAPPRR